MTTPRGAGTTPPSTTSTSGTVSEVVALRHPGRWLAGAVVAVLAAMLVHTLFFSHVARGGRSQPRFQWSVISHYFTSGFIMGGLVVTLEVTALAMVGGIVIGVILAVMRLSPNPIVSGAAWLYIWFFRGTPVLVQLLFWYNASYIFPSFSLGVPFGPALVHIDLNSALTPFVAAAFGLALNEGAYMSEIVRAGILSVDEGQTEAAQSLGMGRLMTLRLVVLPQAMRVIIPPTGNETISMLKTSSLASIVTLSELLFRTESIYSQNFQTVPLLVMASLWYLTVTTVLVIGQYYVERHYARGSSRRLPPTPRERLLSALSIRPRDGGGRGWLPTPGLDVDR